MGITVGQGYKVVYSNHNPRTSVKGKESQIKFAHAAYK